MEACSPRYKLRWSTPFNVLATMDVKNWKGTQPLSTSKRSFKFLTLFLAFALSSNTLFTYSCTSPGEGERGVTITLVRATYLWMSVTPNISVLLVKSLYLRPLVSDHLYLSLTRVSTVFLILAERSWFLKLYGLVLLLIVKMIKDLAW